MADGTATHRSITRGSHNSHASASARTRSWVYLNQMNPPPPPSERSSSSGFSNFYGPRRLVRYPTPEAEDEGEEYTQLDSSSGMQSGQQTKALAKGEGNCLSKSMGNGQDRVGRGGRSLVGGLMHGLRRLPTVLRIGGGQKSKRKLVRQGPFGVVGTLPSATGIVTGNTLPRYLSNPSIGPSNPQFANRLGMDVPISSLPSPYPSPSSFQSRLEPRPKFPSLIRTTPSSVSESVTEEELTDIYNEPPADNPQFGGQAPNTYDTRTTVMTYNSDISHPTSTPPAQPIHGPRVSYASQPHPRAKDQIRDETPAVPTVAFASPPMSHRGTSSDEEPNNILSPQPTSCYTMTSQYDPSFSSELDPVERFFKCLYHLPWVARGRITVDYLPGDSNRPKIKVKGKRPIASWYRAVRGGRDLDLLSNGTGSASASTSLGQNLTPLASPTPGRSERSSIHLSSRRNRRHRKARHRTINSTDRPQRSPSPLVPAVYPYRYPPYPRKHRYSTYPDPVSVPLPVNHTTRLHEHRHVPKSRNGGQGMRSQQVMPQGSMQMSPLTTVAGALTQDSPLASPPNTPRHAAPHSSYYMTLRGTFASKITNSIYGICSYILPESRVPGSRVPETAPRLANTVTGIQGPLHSYYGFVLSLSTHIASFVHLFFVPLTQCPFSFLF